MESNNWYLLYIILLFILFILNIYIDNTILYPMKIAPISKALNYIIISIFVYLLLSWYFNQVIDSGRGVKYPFYFFLTPSYWNIKVKKPIIEGDRILHEKVYYIFFYF